MTNTLLDVSKLSNEVELDSQSGVFDEEDTGVTPESIRFNLNWK
jgi:hypothetical protein